MLRWMDHIIFLEYCKHKKDILGFYSTDPTYIWLSAVDHSGIRFSMNDLENDEQIAIATIGIVCHFKMNEQKKNDMKRLEITEKEVEIENENWVRHGQVFDLDAILNKSSRSARTHSLTSHSNIIQSQTERTIKTQLTN